MPLRPARWEIPCAVTPMVEALSRSRTTCNCGFFSCKSLPTSRKSGSALNSLFEQCRDTIQFRRVGALQGKLVKTAAQPSADADDRRILQRNADTRHPGQLGEVRINCPRDCRFIQDVSSDRGSLRARLEFHENTAGIAGQSDTADADAGEKRLDIGILGDDGGELLLVAHHLFDRKRLAPLRC